MFSICSQLGRNERHMAWRCSAHCPWGVCLGEQKGRETLPSSRASAACRSMLGKHQELGGHRRKSGCYSDASLKGLLLPE